MTERSLYVGLVFLTGVLTVCRPIAAGARQDVPPCATCAAVAMAPGQSLQLPENLHGLTILFTASAGKTPDLATAVAAVRAAGGRPGVLVPAGSSGGAADYDVKVHITELRGALPPDVLIVLEQSTGTDAGGTAAYADVIAAADAARLRRSGIRAWTLVDGVTAAGILERTKRDASEQWVVRAPADVVEAHELLRDLARAAAPRPDAFTEDVVVTAAARLTAAEIVARHQAVARRQASRVTSAISSGTMTLTFEAPGFPAPVSIAAETIVYQAPGRTEIEQRTIRVNGLKFRGGSIPRLPIIEPERVATPPLAIALTDVYRYRLEGEARVNGTRCYVVGFEPAAGEGRSLFRGRAWIAADSFAMLKIAAVQTQLRGAIVSSEQVDEFREVEPGAWMVERSEVRQLYEGAGHRTPIQRVLVLTSHQLNPPDFQQRLQAAYASRSVMLRDTAEGYRYLKREPAPSAAGAAVPIVPAIAGRSSRVRTLAAGVIIDPNISSPLPFAGLSYVDFDLFGTGAQLNAFFGGSYGQLAFSVPSVRGTRWQLAGRAFGIASSYNDRAFRGGREIYEENLRQRPAHASVWMVRPLSPRLSVRAGYELDYTRLRSSPETAPAFIVPSDQVVHGARLAVEAQRAGWAASAWWNPARRSGWTAWGRGDADFSGTHRTFQRYGLTVSRAAAISSSLVARAEGTVMAGRDLDRFSRYAFGTFDNRLRGYPSALVRYDRGAVGRMVLAWSARRFVRLDGFLDSALVRDRGFGTGYRSYTGIGAAAEAPLPFGLLGALEWGYGFRGVRSDGGLGTHVVRVTAFKVF